VQVGEGKASEALVAAHLEAVLLVYGGGKQVAGLSEGVRKRVLAVHALGGITYVLLPVEGLLNKLKTVAHVLALEGRLDQRVLAVLNHAIVSGGKQVGLEGK
jgi:hypothetical protein